MLLFNGPLAALVLLSLQPAAPQLCSQVVGDDPPKSHPDRDGAFGLIVVDQTHGGLPAGTIDSWTVVNPGAAAPILMQAWRAVGSRTFKLVCETKATLKAGTQTIAADPPCEIEEGDAVGWRQDGISPAKTGGIGTDTMKCDPGCTNPGCNDCPVCNNRYNGVVWNKWPVPPATFKPIAIGETFEISGCGARAYSISVSVSGECFACAVGCNFLIVMLLCGGAYLGGGMLLRQRQGAGATGDWKELLPHQAQWLALRALVEDGAAFTKGRRKGFQRLDSPAATADGGVQRERDDAEEERNSSSNSKRRGKHKHEKETGRAGKKEKEKEKESRKEGKAKASSKSKPSSSSSAPATPEQQQVSDAEAAERELRETRVHDERLHASQARVKVVGLNGY